MTLLLALPMAKGKWRWGIMSTFPLPMPVMYDAQVFPRFFTTNRELGLAYLPLDEQTERVKENRTFSLAGSLCFLVPHNDSMVSSPCVQLKNQSSAWLKKAAWGSGDDEVIANVSVLYGWWPVINSTTGPGAQPKLAPFCRGTQDEEILLPWTGCQARDSSWVVKGYYSFSPYMGEGTNFTTINPRRSNINPFDQWLLCGINGSCTDLTPMVMLKGGKGEKGQLSFSWTGRLSPGASVWTATNIKYKAYRTHSFDPAPVCVWPPFVWIVSNSSKLTLDKLLELKCNLDLECYYVLFWMLRFFP